MDSIEQARVHRLYQHLFPPERHRVRANRLQPRGDRRVRHQLDRVTLRYLRVYVWVRQDSAFLPFLLPSEGGGRGVFKVAATDRRTHKYAIVY